MRTESTVKPATVEVRKLGIIDWEPCIYLYLNSGIKQETKPDLDGEPRTMYLYDTVQITNPVPVELLPAIDLTQIADHSYNQTQIKQRTRLHLDKIKTSLRLATTENTKQVDRLDRHTTPTPATIENIKDAHREVV